MKEFIKHKITGLLRTRVLLSVFGLILIYNKPNIAQWAVAILGMAMGVSAVDAWKGNRDGRGPVSGDTPRDPRNSYKISESREYNSSSERTVEQNQQLSSRDGSDKSSSGKA